MKKESLSLRFLYNTYLGRTILKILINPIFSKFAFLYLNSRFSKIMIKKYIKKYNIDMGLYEDTKYKSFNDFFKRQKKENKIEFESSSLITPSDGFISFYNISKDSIFRIKNSNYKIQELLKNEILSKEFLEGGICVIVRLEPQNFHRYIYIDNGKVLENVKISGVLHTVRPIAFEKYPVYIQNSREYAVIETENLGKIVQMEIGALLVGRIENDKNKINVIKGEEKGHFEFGGSTIMLLIKKDKIELEEKDILNMDTGVEREIKIGQKIGNIRKIVKIEEG